MNNFKQEQQSYGANIVIHFSPCVKDNFHTHTKMANYKLKCFFLVITMFFCDQYNCVGKAGIFFNLDYKRKIQLLVYRIPCEYSTAFLRI